MTDEQIAALKEPGGRRQDLFSLEEQAMLRFADLLNSNPGNIDQTDISALAQYFSKEQIIEIVLMVSIANLNNRITEGLQIPRG